MSRARGQMSDELFHKIIKEGKAMGVYNYSPFFMGEPFIFPKIWDWLTYMEKEGVGVGLYTNGEYVDVERIIKYKNIRYLNFSINAATAETHKKIMKTVNFDKVVDNYFKARELAPFTVRASFVTVEDNVAEVAEFKKKFKKTEVVPFTNWTGDQESALAKKGERVPCYPLLHQMMVLWDGRVVPCCSDYNAKMVLGDANKNTLKEIWDSYEWMRKRHEELDFSMSVCKDCNYNCV
jgi:radical SAM protein with 4Fe4S-binding SPASM domain